MPPKLSGGIDHVHVYVRNRADAEAWYSRVLGCTRVAEYEFWAEDPGGPLTLQCAGGRVHLALFAADKGPTDTLAFGATGEEFVAWLTHLRGCGVECRVTDQGAAFSDYPNLAFPLRS